MHVACTLWLPLHWFHLVNQPSTLWKSSWRALEAPDLLLPFGKLAGHVLAALVPPMPLEGHLRTTPRCSPPGNVCVPTDLFWLGMSPPLSNYNANRTNKNNANWLVYFRKSNPFGIRGPFWKHDRSLGTLEISQDVPGHPEENVGLNCGWDLCKIQLKTESKDLAILMGRHWI